MADTHGGPRRQLHSIQALRFVAAFGVVVHHSLTANEPSLTSVLVGAAGVDIFFVISGVVIGYADHDGGAWVFAAKRLIRMIPLYWIATAVAALARYEIYRVVPSGELTVRSLLLLPDFSRPDWYPIYVPAWTLCFEAAFYALFALVLPWTGRNATLSMAVVGVSLAALRVPVPFVPAAFFNTSYFLEFAAGLLLAEALRRDFHASKFVGALSLSSGLMIFAIHYGGWPESHLMNWGMPAILVVFGALCLEESRLWRSRALMLGGSASYAIYLFHVSAMEPLLFWLEHHGVDLHSRLRFIALREVLLVGFAMLVGFGVHLVVERPLLRRLRALLPARRGGRGDGPMLQAMT